MTKLANDIFRCYGKDCDIKQHCKRNIAIALDDKDDQLNGFIPLRPYKHSFIILGKCIEFIADLDTERNSNETATGTKP